MISTIALKSELHPLASQLVCYSWPVDVWGWRASPGKEKGPSIPVVDSGCTGDDEVGRNVVAGSGAMERAVIREEQIPPQSGRSLQAYLGSRNPQAHLGSRNHS